MKYTYTKKCGELLLNPSLYFLLCRENLAAILQAVLDELRFKNSFKTLVEILQLEAQKQNEVAELMSMVERNVKEINRLHHLLKKEFKEGMDKINYKRNIIAKLKVRIITIVSVINSKFLRCKYSEVDM
jgi:two-component sensor histidine kinase